MRRFYIAVILFMLPIFVFMGGVEYVVRQIPSFYKYKNEWMNRNADRVETLIYGSSHGMNGINPSYIDGLAFNLGLMSQSLKYDAFLLLKWGDQYKKLKTIIVPISYFTFFFDEPFGSPQVPCYYKNYMDCPYHSGVNRYSFEMLYFKQMHGKYVTVRNNGWKVLCDELGWLGSDPKAPDWDDPVQAKKTVQLHSGTTDYVSSNYDYLREMALYCKTHQVRMILVSTPMWKIYNQLLDSNRVEIIRSQIYKIQKEFGLEYYNYREDSRFAEDDFSDIQHLSASGAKKFTKILMNDINAKGN